MEKETGIMGESAKKDTSNAPEIGAVMADGTIYAGLSPNTGRPMFAAPADAPLTLNFKAAAKYAKELHIGDKNDFRVPTPEELDVLFHNRDRGALKGTFNTSGNMYTGGMYGTSKDYYHTHIFVQRFLDGQKSANFLRTQAASIRCVR